MNAGQRGHRRSPKPGGKPITRRRIPPTPVAGRVDQLLWLDGIVYRFTFGRPRVTGTLKTIKTRMNRRTNRNREE